jgi:hypothetical protein
MNRRRKEECKTDNKERHLAQKKLMEIVRQRDFMNAKKDNDEKFSKADLMLVVFLGVGSLHIIL